MEKRSNLPLSEHGKSYCLQNPEHPEPLSSTEIERSKVWKDNHDDSVELPSDSGQASSSSKIFPNQTCGRFLIVMLVGVPGSGKSTFCSKVMENRGQSWVRICQDSIRNGKSGTKEACIRHATKALIAGKNILIDRCNANEQQRREFLVLAQQYDVEAHAVILDLPTKLCIERAVLRTGHEGRLQGGKAVAPIRRISKDLKFPDVKEGFARVTICKTENDIEKAILWYRKKVPPFQSHREFFSMEDASGSVIGEGNLREVPKLEASFEERRILKQLEKPPFTSEGSSETTRLMLAFPSLSTSDFNFDHERAADIMIESVREFLAKDANDGLSLILVDICASSDMFVRVSKIAAKLGLYQKGFATFPGDITKLHSRGGLTCQVIANCANWRLKSGCGGVNSAIFRAAGEDFEHATKECATILNPGETLVVPVPEISPLFKDEKVTHIIHVLGANMNPNRPHCLFGDYDKGCKILRTAYANLFESFSCLAKGKDVIARKKSLNDLHSEESIKSNQISSMPLTKCQDTSINAFTYLMQPAKRKSFEVGEASMKREKNIPNGQDSTGTTRKVHGADLVKPGCTFVNDKIPNVDRVRQDHTLEEHHQLDKLAGKYEVQAPGKKWDKWALALRNIALHPEQHKDAVIQVTDDAVVVRDAYPKGKKHVLVIARVDGMGSLNNVREEHFPLLHHMGILGQSIAKSFLQEDPSFIFRLGYHWVPSMQQLHLHVISQDFDSTYLKKRHHWNSFNTEFFKDSAAVLDELKKFGNVKECPKETASMLLESVLRCHRCLCVQPNMPKLKAHILTCTVPFPHKVSKYLITSTPLACSEKVDKK